MQASRRSGFSHRRGVAARGAGEVDLAQASGYAASVVGAAAAGFVAGGGAKDRLKEDIDFHIFLLYLFGSLKEKLDKDGY